MRKIIIVSSITLSFIFFYNIYLFYNFQMHRNQVPFGWDFIQHYAASILVLQGNPSQVYNFETILEVEGKIAGQKIDLYPLFLIWNYPPTFLLLVTPLSFLPYKIAFVLWLLVFFLTYLIILYRIAPDWSIILMAIAFPATFWNFLHGQNGFLFASFLGAGLLILNRYPLAAGALFGFITCKPHLSILIPFAFLAGRRWWALIGMALTVGIMTALSCLLFGLETWAAFLHNIPFAKSLLEQGYAPVFKNASVFAAARTLGLNSSSAYSLQALAAILSIGIVSYSWHKQVRPHYLYTILVLCMLLSTPYLLVHDLAMLMFPLACQSWEGFTRGWRPYEKITLMAAWGMPLYSSIFTYHYHLPVGPLVLAFFLFMVLFRSFSSETVLLDSSIKPTGNT